METAAVISQPCLASSGFGAFVFALFHFVCLVSFPFPYLSFIFSLRSNSSFMSSPQLLLSTQVTVMPLSLSQDTLPLLLIQHSFCHFHVNLNVLSFPLNSDTFKARDSHNSQLAVNVTCQWKVDILPSRKLPFPFVSCFRVPDHYYSYKN